MMQHLFITGTDTGVGKTRVTAGVIEQLKQQGLKVAGMKPIASGCENTAQGLRNEDAIIIQQGINVEFDYEQLNPYAFEPAIAPHIAAQQLNVDIDIDVIKRRFNYIVEQADVVVVEGAGGWLVPINHIHTLADAAKQLDLDVILVVGLRLGCINHALLTVEAIKQSGLNLIGWVANDLESNLQSPAMITTLKQRIDSPCLGEVPQLKIQQSAATFLNLGFYHA